MYAKAYVCMYVCSQPVQLKSHFNTAKHFNAYKIYSRNDLTNNNKASDPEKV